KIGVSAEQIADIKPGLTRFRESSREQRKQINRLRRELIDLLATDEPAREAIAAKEKEILEGHRKMQELVVKQLLTEKSVLTPEQRKAFFDLIRSHCGCDSGDKELGLLERMHRALEQPAPEAPNDCADVAKSPS